MFWPNMKSVALPVREKTAIAVLGGGCGKSRPQRDGDGTVRKSVGEFL